MAERSKAADCKSVGSTHVGSNPTFLILKRSYNQINFLKKNIKIFIRKAKTESSIKKDILINLTLSQNSLKPKNVSFVLNLFTSNLKNFWIYSKILEKNLLRKELNKVQSTIRGSKGVLNDISPNKLSLGLSNKQKFFNFLTFIVAGQILYPQYKKFNNKKLLYTSNLSKIKFFFIAHTNFIKLVLKTQKVYYNVPLNRQFSFVRFNKHFLSTKRSQDTILTFFENWYSFLKKDNQINFLPYLNIPAISKIINSTSKLILKPAEWLTQSLEKQKDIVHYITSEIQKSNTSISSSVFDQFGNLNTTKFKSTYYLNTNIIKISRHYMKASDRTYLFTQSLVLNKIPKLINPAILILNFRKSRFFPSLTNLKGRLFSTMSLGMFSKFFNKGKSFIKNKSVFLLIAGFIRKLILFSEITGAMLQVKRVPLYFKEILSALHDPVVSFYKNPFTGQIINEIEEKNTFKFTSFMFLNNKPYGKIKNKQKGRLKRKITKRLISINRMVD